MTSSNRYRPAGSRRVARTPPERTRIVIAAMRPRLCRLGGEAADGVRLNWMLPRQAAQARQWVWEGADDAGREAPVVASYVRVAVGPGSSERLRTGRTAIATSTKPSPAFRGDECAGWQRRSCRDEPARSTRRSGVVLLRARPAHRPVLAEPNAPLTAAAGRSTRALSDGQSKQHPGRIGLCRSWGVERAPADGCRP